MIKWCGNNNRNDVDNTDNYYDDDNGYDVDGAHASMHPIGIYR